MTDEPSGFHERVREAYDAEVTPRRAEMRRLAAAMRLVIERLVATTAPEAAISAAAEALEAVAASLEGYPQGRLFEGFAETANAGDPHAFFDHSPIIGRANPIAPPVELGVVGEKVEGTARFGSAYEGPPGCVHGGHIAAAFDEVLGMTQSLSGQPGMTGTLTVRYRRPTPLHADLRFEGELVRREGRKIFTEGRLYHGDELTATAEAIFISVDFSRLFGT
jgi:acyl-coenzyme A thioesterase PaaI-like protein